MKTLNIDMIIRIIADFVNCRCYCRGSAESRNLPEMSRCCIRLPAIVILFALQTTTGASSMYHSPSSGGMAADENGEIDVSQR